MWGHRLPGDLGNAGRYSQQRCWHRRFAAPAGGPSAAVCPEGL